MKMVAMVTTLLTASVDYVGLFVCHLLISMFHTLTVSFIEDFCSFFSNILLICCRNLNCFDNSYCVRLCLV